MNRDLPIAWAFHAYSDGQATAGLSDNEAPSFTRLRNFLRATRDLRGRTSPNIWLTEQGARRIEFVTVRDENGQPVLDGSGEAKREEKRNSESCQARIVRFLSRAPSVTTRIKRFYLYQLRGDDGFDFGLLRSNYTRRPAYSVYRARTDASYQDSTDTMCP